MIAIIKYNAGNIGSVQNALNRLNCPNIVTDDHKVISAADKVIFPGVGEANSAMEYLRGKNMDQLILSLRQPFLGICLGLQLMCISSEEGDTQCLGIFDTKVKQFPPKDKVPHMGWNNFQSIKGPLFDNVNAEDDLYYVHKYYAETCTDTTAVCDYILPFSASLVKDNFFATQFHPEKSDKIGERILQNFIQL